MCIACAFISHAEPPSLFGSAGGSRTHRHLGLSQVALPICVPRQRSSTTCGSRTRLACLKGRQPHQKSNVASIHSVSEVGLEPTSSGFRRRRDAACATRRSLAPSITSCYDQSDSSFYTNQSSRAPGGSRTHLSTVAGWCLDRSATGASVSGRRGSRTLKSFWPRPGSNRVPSPLGLPLRLPSPLAIINGDRGRL